MPVQFGSSGNLQRLADLLVQAWGRTEAAHRAEFLCTAMEPHEFNHFQEFNIMLDRIKEFPLY